MELKNIERTGMMSCNGLNLEEISGLEIAMMKRKLEENLPGKMYFWGKIFGTTQDYLIVHNIDPYAAFPERKYYFCTPPEFVLKALPSISSEYMEKADKLKSSFTGDPSLFAFDGEGEIENPEDEDPDAAPTERFCEIHRLSFTVSRMDHDCALVPRGALVVDASKRVIPSAHFDGLSFLSAGEKRSYMHCRKPESLQGIALLQRPGIVMTGDYLDCIDKDTPSGMWCVFKNPSGTTAIVKNLYWEGFTFYTVLGSSEHGNVYFGTGIPNYDIAFML